MSGRKRQRLALITAHRSDAHFADEIGILAEGFLDAAPARIARHVDHRGEHFVCAARADLASDHRVDARDEIGIPGACFRNRLREHGCVVGGIAVQAFLVEEDRDAEACFLHCPVLDGVDESHSLARIASGILARRTGTALIRRPCEQTEAVGVHRLRLRRIKGEFVVEELDLLAPDAEELHDFLLECHAAHEVVDACFHGRVGILVKRNAR